MVMDYRSTTAPARSTHRSNFTGATQPTLMLNPHTGNPQ
jgi:hypothetical protein